MREPTIEELRGENAVLAGLLHDARIKYRQAMHDEEVRRLIGA